MYKQLLFLLFCFLFIYPAMINAQPKIIKIWPSQVPGTITKPDYKEISEVTDILRISKVSDPTIAVFLPPAEKATGTAVVICPGGGYGILAYDYEGTDIAKWLNTIGIAGIVLKYRLPSDLIMNNKTLGPLQDAQEAIRIVRRNAKVWNINPQKIGIMGFSAGGHLASTLSTHYMDKVYETTDNISARPDFSVLIYPVISMNKDITHGGSRTALLGGNPNQAIIDKFSNELHVNNNTPATFLVHAADDEAVPVQNSINYFLALQKYNVPAELHIYETGGHGFSIPKSKGTESSWPEAFRKWLSANNFL